MDSHLMVDCPMEMTYCSFISARWSSDSRTGGLKAQKRCQGKRRTPEGEYGKGRKLVPLCKNAMWHAAKLGCRIGWRVLHLW